VLEGCAARRALPSCAGVKGIAESLYYSWSKEFLEAGKKRLGG
jgi:transposase